MRAQRVAAAVPAFRAAPIGSDARGARPPPDLGGRRRRGASSEAASDRKGLASSAPARMLAGNSSNPAGMNTSDCANVCTCQPPMWAPSQRKGPYGREDQAHRRRQQGYQRHRDRDAHQPAHEQVGLRAPEGAAQHRAHVAPEAIAPLRERRPAHAYVEQAPRRRRLDLPARRARPRRERAVPGSRAA